VLFGVALSLLLLMRRASRPRVVEVGRVPGTAYFADAVRHPENECLPDVLVFRTEGSLLYFNIDHVRDRLAAILTTRTAPPRLIVFFMGQVPFVDLAGAELLSDLHTKFEREGIAFKLAEARGEVRDALQRLGGAHSAPLAEANRTVDNLIEAWRASAPTMT